MSPIADEGVAVVGNGYVGTVVAACFAHLGYRVVGLEADPHKLAALRRGDIPFHEPGLDELVTEGLVSDRLAFTGSVEEAVASCAVMFLCVGTPSGPDGHADVSAVEAAASAIAGAMSERRIIVTKSTVPVGTGRWLSALMEACLPEDHRGRGLVSVVSNPEFLREGSAIEDFLHPDRVVLGGDDPAAVGAVAELYRPILEGVGGGEGAERPTLVRTPLETAEMVKYTSNAFLATKVSFANEIANICEGVGADVTEVMAAVGLDDRIGARFLDAGAGWGGSCFGKDVRELAATARDVGCHPAILRAAIEVNHGQRRRIVDRLEGELGSLAGRRIGILGLAFKPGTDDLRDAPSLDIIRGLRERGARVIAHDPMVTVVSDFADVEYATEPLDVARDADAIVLVTDWSDYLGLDLERVAAGMRGDLLMDGRNVLDPAAAARAGLSYVGIGRPHTADVRESV